MLSAAAIARSLERVGMICDSAGGALALRRDLLEEIGRVVRFDAYAWLLTDPETSVGTAPLADVPLLPELPRLIRLKYLTRINRWTTLSGSSVALLREATRGDLSRSRLWKELLCDHHVIDIASVVFRDRFGCWAFLDLWRPDSMAPFSESDVEFLARIVKPVTHALRRSQANTFLASRSSDRLRIGPVVLLLSPDLMVLDQTPETEAHLRILVPPADGRPPVPAGAYNVAAQLLAVEAGVDRNLPAARVHLSDGRWVTMRAARLGAAKPPAVEADIAVSIEESSPAERTTLFALSHGLTARETELLGHVTAGAGTREIASRMFLSEHTVQDHLKSIFAKTGVHTRRTLLSRLLGS